MNGRTARENSSYYLRQVLWGGNVEQCTLPECPESGEVACVDHLERWIYCSPDPRDEE